MILNLCALWCKSEPVPVVVHHAHALIEAVALWDVERPNLLWISEGKTAVDVDAFHQVIPSRLDLLLTKERCTDLYLQLSLHKVMLFDPHGSVDTLRVLYAIIPILICALVPVSMKKCS